MNTPMDPVLDKAADLAFWEAFEQNQTEERYVVVNTRTNEVLVQNARLVKEQKKITV